MIPVCILQKFFTIADSTAIQKQNVNKINHTATDTLLFIQELQKLTNRSRPQIQCSLMASSKVYKYNKDTFLLHKRFQEGTTTYQLQQTMVASKNVDTETNANITLADVGHMYLKLSHQECQEILFSYDRCVTQYSLRCKYNAKAQVTGQIFIWTDKPYITALSTMPVYPL